MEERSSNERRPILDSSHHPKYKSKQYTAALSASLISLATGCVGGWSSSAVPLLMAGAATELGGIEQISTEQASWITSLINLGALVGSLPAGQMSFYLGRRKFLLMLGGLLIVGWSFIIWNFNHVEFLYIGRFICGFAAGSSCVALAMYSNEICCDTIRGRSGSFFDMMQVFGILFVYAVSALTNIFWSSIICLMVPILYMSVFYWMPESPVYLIRHGRKDEALQSIRWLNGESCDIDKHLQRIHMALLEGKNHDYDEDQDFSHYYLASIQKFYNSLSKTTIKAVFIILILFIVQRSCGAPIVVYYTVDIFESTPTNINPQTATVLAGLSQFLFSASAMVLVDHVGRKVLLTLSFTVMTLSLSSYVIFLLLASSAEDTSLQDNYGWFPVTAVCLFVGIFRLGVGPIPWFMCAELIPTEAQRWALPTIFFICWGVAFMCSKAYLAAVASFGHAMVFAFFMVICMLGLLHTSFNIPETKNKSRKQIQEELAAGKGPSTSVQAVAEYEEIESEAEPIIIIEN